MYSATHAAIWQLEPSSDNSEKMVVFTIKNSITSSKAEVLHVKLKTVLLIVILKFINSNPNFTKFLNPYNTLSAFFTHIEF